MSKKSIGFLREIAKQGFRSINLPAYPQAADLSSTSAGIKNMADSQVAALTGDPSSKRAYWQPEFEPFWAEVSDLDITITMHLGGRITRFGENDHFLPDHLMSKIAMAEPICVAIYGGLFERFPKLKWAMIESGVGWMAFAAQYMDHSWGKHRHWVGNKNPHPPSYYMDHNVWGSFLRDRIGIEMRNMPGGKNIMWSSDFPHSETTYPHSREWIASDFDGFPTRTCARSSAASPDGCSTSTTEQIDSQHGRAREISRVRPVFFAGRSNRMAAHGAGQ